jgi:hypothetical protein
MVNAVDGRKESLGGERRSRSGALVGSRPNDRRCWPVTAVVPSSMP